MKPRPPAAPSRRALLQALAQPLLLSALWPAAAQSTTHREASRSWVLPGDGGRHLLRWDDASLKPLPPMALSAPWTGLACRLGAQLLLPLSDGTLTRWQLDGDGQHWELQTERALGQRCTGLAASGDGRWLLALVPDSPAPVQLLDAVTLQTHSHWAEAGVSAVQVAALRRSFIISGRQGVAEISVDPRAEDFYEGLVHDYRMGEGIPRKAYLNLKRSKTNLPHAALQSLLLDPPQGQCFGVAADGSVPLINLDLRRQVGQLPLGPAPLLATAIVGTHAGRQLLACTDAFDPLLRLVDLDSARIHAQTPLSAPGARLALSHAAHGRIATLAPNGRVQLLTLPELQTVPAQIETVPTEVVQDWACDPLAGRLLLRQDRRLLLCDGRSLAPLAPPRPLPKGVDPQGRLTLI